jgi:hypothetical protein
MKSLNIVLSIVVSCGVFFANASWASNVVTATGNIASCPACEVSHSSDDQTQDATKATGDTQEATQDSNQLITTSSQGQQCLHCTSCSSDHCPIDQYCHFDEHGGGNYCSTIPVW